MTVLMLSVLKRDGGGGGTVILWRRVVILFPKRHSTPVLMIFGAVVCIKVKERLWF